MSILKWINVVLRGLMEAGIIIAIAYWGYQLSSGTLIRTILCIALPILVFGFWGWFDFRQFGKYAETLRLLQEMAISLGAAYVLYFYGKILPGIILASISVVHHIIIYLLGDKLLK
ncbi:MAG: YrdB family protein [Chitinophagales bacterium]|nr:YrdB family protein [Chitinophagales bacterium]